MAIYVYMTATGVLASYCPNDTDPVASAATLTAQGMTAVSGLPQLAPDRSNAWDPATKTVIAVTPPVLPRMITTADWLLLFTAAETTTIRNSTDANVMQFLFALSHSTQMNLNNPAVVNGVNYLVSLGLLTAARAAIIMA